MKKKIESVPIVEKKSKTKKQEVVEKEVTLPSLNDDLPDENPVILHP